MTNRLDDINEQLASVTRVINTLDTSLVDTRLTRGKLWRDLCGCNKDALPDTADRLKVDLSVAKQEKYMAGVYDAPINDWLDWSTHRELASLDEPTRDRLIDEAVAAGQATSAHVRRLAREEKASRRGAGAEDPSGDPVTAESRAAYMLSRFGDIFAAEFAPDTIALIASYADRFAGEWEAAAAATIESVFGRVPVEAEA